MVDLPTDWVFYEISEIKFMRLVNCTQVSFHFQKLMQNGRFKMLLSSSFNKHFSSVPLQGKNFNVTCDLSGG